MSAFIETLSDLSAGGIAIWLAIGVAIVLTFVQVAPIKVNPWSWLARKLGRAINGEVIDQVKALDVKLSALENTFDERDAKAARTRVLRFGDECRQGIQHSQEHFNEILLDIKNYNDYCSSHEHFENDRMTITAQLIEERYKRCLEENSFI